MATPIQMEIKRDEVAQIVESVFREMLGLEAVEYTPAAFARVGGRASLEVGLGNVDQVVASVELNGDWNGMVVVACKSRQACIFAGRFLSMEAPLRVDDVACDVVGELANMIGGNLKCVLTRGIKLSTPHVTHGVEWELEDGRDFTATELVFRCQGREFSVAILAAA